MQHAESLFPNQELNLCSLHWKHGVLTTGLPEEVPIFKLKKIFFVLIGSNGAQLMGSHFLNLEGQSPSHWTTMEFPDLISSFMIITQMAISTEPLSIKQFHLNHTYFYHNFQKTQSAKFFCRVLCCVKAHKRPNVLTAPKKKTCDCIIWWAVMFWTVQKDFYHSWNHALSCILKYRCLCRLLF